MRIVAGSIWVLAGTIALSVGLFLSAAYPSSLGVILVLLGIVQVVSGVVLMPGRRDPAE